MKQYYTSKGWHFKGALYVRGLFVKWFHDFQPSRSRS